MPLNADPFGSGSLRLEQLAFTVGVLAVLLLGLSAGALLAEAGVLVPMWRSQDPESFLAWYQQHAGLLLRFFGPLEVSSSLLVVAAAASAWLADLPGQAPFFVSTGLTLAVLASFPLYFINANARFAAGSIPTADVGAELRRWARWHWARTGLAIVAFNRATGCQATGAATRCAKPKTADRPRGPGAGANVIVIQSDPNAPGFYHALGATLAKQLPSSIPGRTIPFTRSPTRGEHCPTSRCAGLAHVDAIRGMVESRGSVAGRRKRLNADPMGGKSDFTHGQ